MGRFIAPLTRLTLPPYLSHPGLPVAGHEGCVIIFIVLEMNGDNRFTSSCNIRLGWKLTTRPLSSHPCRYVQLLLSGSSPRAYLPTCVFVDGGHPRHHRDVRTRTRPVSTRLPSRCPREANLSRARVCILLLSPTDMCGLTNSITCLSGWYVERQASLPRC